MQKPFTKVGGFFYDIPFNTLISFVFLLTIRNKMILREKKMNWGFLNSFLRRIYN